MTDKPDKLLAQIILPHACFGVDIKDGVIVYTAPIGRWMIGKKHEDVRKWVESNNGTMEIIG